VGKRVLQIIQWFLFFNGPNHSGAGAKSFSRLEPEPNNLDARSRSRKFEFRLHSSDTLNARTPEQGAVKIWG